MVQFLLDHKADVNLVDGWGKTALEVVLKAGAGKKGEQYSEVVEIISGRMGPEKENTQDISCPSVLFKAIDTGNHELVGEYMNAHPQLANSRIKMKRSYAFWYGTVR